MFKHPRPYHLVSIFHPFLLILYYSINNNEISKAIEMQTLKY